MISIYLIVERRTESYLLTSNVTKNYFVSLFLFRYVTLQFLIFRYVIALRYTIFSLRYAFSITLRFGFKSLAMNTHN
jgi:hypothetical protein